MAHGQGMSEKIPSAAMKALGGAGKPLHSHEVHLRRTDNGGYVATHHLRDKNGRPPQDGQRSEANTRWPTRRRCWRTWNRQWATRTRATTRTRSSRGRAELRSRANHHHKPCSNPKEQHMSRGQGQLAYIHYVEEHGGHPDQGLPGSGGHPDQGLPGMGGHPDQGLPPQFGGGQHPSQGLPRPGRPPHTWPPQRPQFPPEPTDPEWGIDAGGSPSHPIYIPIGPDQGLPGQPAHPSQGLPPVAGGPKPPTDPPPGHIWPPLPPGLPPGKAAILVWISGVGHRYAVIEIPATPDQSLPGSGGRPNQDLPSSGGAQPKR